VKPILITSSNTIASDSLSGSFGASIHWFYTLDVSKTFQPAQIRQAIAEKPEHGALPWYGYCGDDLSGKRTELISVDFGRECHVRARRQELLTSPLQS